jgi:hypothetical protein
MVLDVEEIDRLGNAGQVDWVTSEDQFDTL